MSFIKILCKYINIPLVVAVYYMVAFCCMRLPEESGYIVSGIMPSHSSGNIDYLQLARWLVLLFTPSVINGFILERSNKTELLSVVRTKGIVQFRRKISLMCFENSIIWVFIISVVYCILFDSLAFKQIVVFGLYVVLLGKLDELLFYSAGQNPKTAALLPIAYILLFMIGECFDEINKYIPSSWGMICRYQNYLEPAILSLASIIVTLFLLHTTNTYQSRQ